MLFLLAQTASNEAIGQWVSVAAIVVIALSGVFGLAAFFATRREVEAQKERTTAMENDLKARISKLEDTIAKADKDNEDRAVNLHNRINQTVENTAEIKGGMSAFTESFRNFTDIITSIAQQPREKK